MRVLLSVTKFIANMSCICLSTLQINAVQICGKFWDTQYIKLYEHFAATCDHLWVTSWSQDIRIWAKMANLRHFKFGSKLTPNKIATSHNSYVRNAVQGRITIVTYAFKVF